MHAHTSPVSLEGGRLNFMRRDRFEINQYVRAQVSDTRFTIGIVTAIDEDRSTATVEARNGYEVTLPLSALRRAFLVVLDLNGVLVARGRGSFISRPHVLEFLKFVFSNFVVAVWTSGLQRSSDPIIEHVFGNYRDLLLFTLFRDACVPKATAENPYGTEKNLQTIFDRYPLSFHAVNTIIIDDSPDKCSHPDIALCPVPFKDPVAQGLDSGLLETMETLREVLLLDSGAPLITAAEERRQRLAAEQSALLASSAHDGGAAKSPAATTPPSAAPTASASPASVVAVAAALPRSPNDGDTPTDLEEVKLWQSRLCCENLQGKCMQGARCPFSHDPDDGRPCSRKSNCRFHGTRWPKTSEETENEARRRHIREAKQQEYKMELEKRQHEQQLQQALQSSRGQPRRGSEGTHQSLQPTAQRQRGGRPRGQQRGGRHNDPWSMDGEEEDDWASAPAGLSHTGDPAYDNMINEQQQQQQQQQRRSNASAARPAAAQAQFNVADLLLHGRDGRQGALQSGGAGNGSGGGNSNNTNLSSGYRRQLQHHNQNSGSNNNSNYNNGNGRDGYPQSHGQQSVRVQEHNSSASASVPFFFQSAPTATSATTTATTTTIQPFSTRPLAPSTASVQPSATPVSIFQLPQPASLSTAPSQRRGYGAEGSQRGSQGQQQQQQQQHQQQQQQQQAIRISGSRGDSSAVVNQLQALMRGS